MFKKLLVALALVAMAVPAFAAEQMPVQKPYLTRRSAPLMPIAKSLAAISRLWCGKYRCHGQGRLKRRSKNRRARLKPL